VLRLKANSDFQRVRREGRSWSHPLVVLIAAQNALEVSRVGITASKAVGGAVRRNRAKRRLRIAVHETASTLINGWDIVLVSRPGLPDADWSAISNALNQLLKRAKIQKDG